MFENIRNWKFLGYPFKEKWFESLYLIEDFNEIIMIGTYLIGMRSILMFGSIRSIAEGF